MNPRALSYMHQLSSVIALFALPIPVILYMVGYWMWLEPGNGEANYLYFQCLAYNIGLAILFLNFCSASLRRDKALRMTQAAERACNVAVEQNSKDIQIGRRLIPSAEVTVETKTT